MNYYLVDKFNRTQITVAQLNRICRSHKDMRKLVNHIKKIVLKTRQTQFIKLSFMNKLEIEL